jgi:hypothetical protein
VNKNIYIVQSLGLQQQRGKGQASLGQGMRVCAANHPDS